MKILILSLFVALSFGLEAQAEPLNECVMCMNHKGTCGCYMGFVVCCDGERMLACSCS